MRDNGSDPVVTKLARKILDGRKMGKDFSPLPREAGIDRVDKAYDIQDALNEIEMKERSTHVAGYKIGLTSPAMQEMCGIESPVSGVIYADRIMHSPAVVRRVEHGRLGLEFEIAVIISSDIDVPVDSLKFEEVGAAVESVCPAIELVDDRNCDYCDLDALSLIADNSWSAGIVLGEPSAPVDLEPVQGIVYADGIEIGRGFGRDALCHPFNSVLWLAQHLAIRGDKLRKGDVVMTGSLIRTQFPRQSTSYRFELAGIGAVMCEVT
jgi:2-keto-4-pentenoate hydratase